VIVILKRDLRCIIYIDINKIFIVYIVKLQNLIMMMSIASMMKIVKYNS